MTVSKEGLKINSDEKIHLYESWKIIALDYSELT